MDFVFWIILIVVVVGVVWWLLNRNKSTNAPGVSGTEGTRADGALSGGGAAASTEAAGTTGIASAAGFGRPAEPAAPTTADDAAEAALPAPKADSAPPAGGRDQEPAGAASTAAPAADTRSSGSHGATEPGQVDRRRKDDDEWETQWSEASGSSAVIPAGASRGGAQERGTLDDADQGNPATQAGAHAATDRQAEPAAPDAAESRPVHHPEYTEPHAPTLPGAETAAVEEPTDADAGATVSAPARAVDMPQSGQGTDAMSSATAAAMPGNSAATETADRTQSSALVETGADHAQRPQRASAGEPAGHLAAEEPYGAGSAAAGADGGGPAGYTVKGDAGAMVYYEEGRADYEQIRADVWFESAAHAEAAGFRAPRRRRL